MTDETYNNDEVEQAQQKEQAALQEATLLYLQNRVVSLHVEVARRDEEIRRLRSLLSPTQEPKADTSEHEG